MDRIRIWQLIVLLVTVISLSCAATTAACSILTGAYKKEARKTQPEIKAQIDPASKDWVEEQLCERRSVVLTNSYLFYVMKGIAQENQKLVEETVLIPLLHQTLKGLVAAASDANTRRLFSVALLLLLEKPDFEVSEQATEEARSIKTNPMLTPTGHYADSEEMQRYFQAMQYLSKAIVDVSVKLASFPFHKEMLYPFEVAVASRKLFAKPQNARLLANWRIIHSFYDSINGASDLPTFIDLIDRLTAESLTKPRMEAWIRRNKMPMINPEMGLGVQPFGERFSLHQGMIDDVKSKLFRDDTPRATIAKTLRFKNLMDGPMPDHRQIRGLASRVSTSKGRSYYSKVLRAIAIGGERWQDNPFCLNFFAASLTGLAEQTALMTRTSTMVSKSPETGPVIEEGLKLYFEPGSERYLRALARASASMVRACNTVRWQAPAGQAGNIEFTNPARAFRTFAVLSGQGKPLITNGPKWRAYSQFITALARAPAVTVDVFRLKDRAGNLFFYQWAIAPFEVIHRPEKSGDPASGMEMVFFEAWADDVVKDTDEGPLTNAQWNKRASEGKLNNLPSILDLHEKVGEAK